MPLYFEWDESKDRANRAKHGVDFETASFVFDDPLALSVPDRTVEGEERWQTIGAVDGTTILLVSHTVKLSGIDELIRIISARRATRSERTRYEKNRG